jgi:hypothetical protein
MAYQLIPKTFSVVVLGAWAKPVKIIRDYSLILGTTKAARLFSTCRYPELGFFFDFSNQALRGPVMAFKNPMVSLTPHCPTD